MIEITELTEAPTAPLTRKEREAMNKLSMDAYGRRLHWQKMLRKGEYRQEAAMTKNGNPISVKRLHYFTMKEVYDTMNKVIADRAFAEALEIAKKKWSENEAKSND